MWTGVSVLGASMIGCSSQQSQTVATSDVKNDLLPQEVVIKYEHNLAVAKDADKIQGLDYVKFIKDLSSKMIDGSVTVYDPMDDSAPFAKKDVDYLFTDRQDTLLDIDENTFDTVPIVKSYTFDPSELQRLVVTEDWFLNSQAFEMTKNVLEYAPVKIIRRDLGNDNYEMQKQLLFWVKPSEGASDKKLLASDVTYEFDLYNMSNPNWMESLSVSRFVAVILNNVLEGKVKAYDFFSEEKVALSVDIVRENLGATVENYFVEDETATVVDTVQVVGNIYPDEIRSVIFVEDWYIDDNMMISKVVKRIAPVRHYYMLNDVAEDEMVKKVPFVVDMNYSSN